MWGISDPPGFLREFIEPQALRMNLMITQTYGWAYTFSESLGKALAISSCHLTVRWLSSKSPWLLVSVNTPKNTVLMVVAWPSDRGCFAGISLAFFYDIITLYVLLLQTYKVSNYNTAETTVFYLLRPDRKIQENTTVQPCLASNSNKLMFLSCWSYVVFVAIYKYQLHHHELGRLGSRDRNLGSVGLDPF